MSEAVQSKRSTNYDYLYWTLDCLISIVVISTFVVGYWRGCWQLMDVYLFPNNIIHSLSASLAIGIGIILVFTLFQNFLPKIFSHSKRPLCFVFFSRFYTIVYCVACVNQWRGVWLAWDEFTGVTWQSGVTSVGVGIFFLGITRSLKNILAPPFLVFMDAPKGYFCVPLLFENKRKKSLIFHILDSLFTVTVVGCLVVFVWRGSWVFLDRKLFANDPILSAWGSLVIGVTVSVLCFLGQTVLLPCSKNIKNLICKIILEDVYFLCCFVGTVNIWRGVWLLLNIYLLPERPVMSNWISTLLGNLVLMSLYCSNSILVRGGLMDGDLAGAKGITLSTKYLRFYLEEKATKHDYTQNIKEEEILTELNNMTKVPVEEQVIEKNVELTEGKDAPVIA